MASITDYLSAGSSTPLGFSMAGMVPQYRLNETAPYLQEDSSIATTRALQDYTQRSLPGLVNQGAAMGQTGSSGLQNRANFMAEDAGRNVSDIQRMLNRNMASIAQQKVMATMGGMF